ncbi:MAG: Maf family protein [Candidatus Obscuribacterales bacterium]|nr:Maf family protein [Candidatus Obscuribacterales bacterium]
MLEPNTPASCDLKIILASSSPRRIQLLQNLSLQFEVKPADIDETVPPGLSPPQIVCELARQKGEKILSDLSFAPSTRYLIIAADTLVARDDEVLGKPIDRQEAIKMLMSLSNRSHSVYTGVHLIMTAPNQGDGHLSRTFFGDTKVVVRSLQLEEVEAYAATGEPDDKAGAYALQGIGAFLIDHIEGCPANVIGLPVPLLVKEMRAMGVAVMGL